MKLLSGFLLFALMGANAFAQKGKTENVVIVTLNGMLAVIGPDTKRSGEQKQPQHLYQKQIVATIASFLGFTFKPEDEAGKLIESITKK